MALMEGTLWKWTNYLSGWQPRYFVLDVGGLAYYKSQEEVGRGSKGSIKMGCCEITVHPTDNVRIDLKIPPDQYIYLRAATSAERQQWLVALGTSKACIAQLDTRKQETDTGTSKTSQLKDKMQELSMYRSLLLQQVNTIKLMCTEKQRSQEFNETATMLSATCDEFLKNLFDCMELADTTFDSNSSQTTHSSKHAAFRKQILHETHRAPHSPPTSPMSTVSSSSGSTISGQTASSSTSSSSEEHRKEPAAQSSPSTPTSTSSIPKNLTRPSSLPNNLNTPTSSKQSVSTNSTTTSALDRQTVKTPEPPVLYNGLPSFFSTAPHKFEDVHITESNGIPTKSFLAACSSILPFFDVLGSTAFAPVKIDIGGNIKKLSTKFDTDPKSFYTLQNMIYQEIKSNSCTAKNSATDALLWLKRALEFMNIFLDEVVKGRQDLAVAAGIAYEKSLRKYHGWVVRGVFALAVKAVPYREDFLIALGTVDQTCAPPQDVLAHTKAMVTALGRILKILNEFYREHQLDSEYTV